MSEGQDELSVLLEQLDELLADGVEDAEDAMEVAVCAGLAHRLGAAEADLAEVTAWRGAAGADLLDEAWREVALEDMLENLDAVSAGGEIEDVEEALFDFDDVVAAAVWCRRGDRVRAASAAVEKLIRDIPEPFAPLADVAKGLARLRSVAEHTDLYGYLFALVDAERWVEGDEADA